MSKDNNRWSEERWPSGLPVKKVKELFRLLIEDRITKLKTMQLAQEPSSAAYTVLTVRIDECNVLLTKWELND